MSNNPLTAVPKTGRPVLRRPCAPSTCRTRRVSVSDTSRRDSAATAPPPPATTASIGDRLKPVPAFGGASCRCGSALDRARRQAERDLALDEAEEDQNRDRGEHRARHQPAP